MTTDGVLYWNAAGFWSQTKMTPEESGSALHHWRRPEPLGTTLARLDAIIARIRRDYVQ